MSLMGDGLKKVAGNRLESVLYRLSNTTLKGVLLGTGVTAVIQSSSATSVMVVGFVNSGMMTLKQALSVIHGALIGTSITGWVICLSYIDGTGWVSIFSTANLTAIVAITGIILRMFSKKQSHHHLGDILLGFAVLMFGMQTMSGAVAPLKESAAFIELLTTFSNPVLGILVGLLFTAVLQSSSAAVGILQALSVTGAVTFSTAYPIILGIAIGASVPVLLSAIGAKLDGRRAAFSYLIIEVIGAALCGVIFYAADAAADFQIKYLIMSPVSIAVLNTAFRLVTAVLLTPFNPQVETLVGALIRENEHEKSANAEFERLDNRFLEHPSLAVEQSRLTIGMMAKKAKDNMLDAIRLLNSYSDAGYTQVSETEDLIDKYEDKLGTYLMKITASEMSDRETENVSQYLHTLSDFERISDHAMNISETAKEIYTKKVHFSGQAQSELKVLTAAVEEILGNAVSAFITNNLAEAYRIEPLEERIDVLCDAMKMRHVDRLQNGKCDLSQGFIFNDILANFERVADHCSNLAVAMIELHDDSFETHGYIINLKQLHSHDFDRYYEEFSEKYSI